MPSRVPAALQPAWYGFWRVVWAVWSRRTRDRILVAVDALWPWGTLVPPALLASVGGGDFAAVGAQFRDHFVALGGLRPDARVLDLGSGAGRIALPLTAYLTAGSYDGVEIWRPHVAWCRRNITRRHPRFRFHHADLHNDSYNPRGRSTAATYRFPFADAAFDFVILTSVLTHLLPEEIDRYLGECARVLAPGGCVFATAFVVDADAAAAIADRRAAYAFVPFRDGAFVVDPVHPAAAVAVDAAWLEERIAAHRLVVVGRHPGGWSGRAPALSFQDILVLARVGEAP